MIQFTLLANILIILMLVNYTIGEDVEETTEIEKISCRKRNRLLSSTKSYHFEMTEVFINETLRLDCHYCNENDEDEPKVWFRIEQTNSTPHEVVLDMNKDETLSKRSVSVDHTLTIIHLSLEDAGIYYCQGAAGQKSENMYNYIVDIVQTNSTPPEKGNLSTWKVYQNDYLIPINKQFNQSSEHELIFIRNQLNTKLEVITDWDPDWGPCEICGRPQGDGIEYKYGYCRIKIENNDNDKINVSSRKNSEKIKYFLTIPKLACDSLFLEELFPDVNKITKWLPDYKLVRKCEGICNPDAEGINSGWKAGRSKGFKYRKTTVLDEGAHLTVICPESTLDNTVTWRRNGKLLKQGEVITGDDPEEIPHLVVDSFNSLYLIHVTPEQEGNYTCQVDEIRMQQLRIYVVKKSRLLTNAFLRHMMYLAFILMLTCSCYCAGIVVTYQGRHKFKKYIEVLNEEA